MEIHAGCQCEACGRVLKRHHGKRRSCNNGHCRTQVRVMRNAMRTSAEAGRILTRPPASIPEGLRDRQPGL